MPAHARSACTNRRWGLIYEIILRKPTSTTLITLSIRPKEKEKARARTPEPGRRVYLGVSVLSRTQLQRLSLYIDLL